MSTLLNLHVKFAWMTGEQPLYMSSMQVVNLSPAGAWMPPYISWGPRGYCSVLVLLRIRFTTKTNTIGYCICIYTSQRFTLSKHMGQSWAVSMLVESPDLPNNPTTTWIQTIRQSSGRQHFTLQTSTEIQPLSAPCPSSITAHASSHNIPASVCSPLTPWVDP